MKIFFCFFSVLSSVAVFSGDTKFPVSGIPAELKENVDVVIREDHMRYTIHDRDRATLYVYQVVTILNENGKRHASEVIGYDKLSRITSFKGASFDANGKQIRRLKKRNI